MWQMFLQMLFRGRYGYDRLGRFLLLCGLIAELAALLLRRGWPASALQLAGFALLLLALMRIFSRKIEARNSEARRFQVMCQRFAKRWQRLRYNWPRLFNGEYFAEHRQYKFLRCPRCAARLRVPRGKGKIVVTCPRCGRKLEGKS